MSGVFADSFSNWTTDGTAVLGKWQTISNNTSNLTPAAGQGRNGNAGLRMFMGGGISGPAGNYLQRAFTTTTRLIMGFAVKINAFDANVEWGIFSWMDGTTAQITLTVDPFGFLRVRRGLLAGTLLGTSSAPVITATGVYFYIEIDVTFNTTTGAVAVHSQGAAVTGLVLTNLNTAPSTVAEVNGLRFGNIGGGSTNFSNGYDAFFSDLYVLDPTVGAHNTAFLGDTRIFPGFPIANGDTNNFTPQPNQANYLNVNQVEQDGDTTYNFDSNASDIDLYQHTPTPASTGTIFFAQLCQVSRKDDAAARSTANILKSAGSFATGATQALSQSYAWYLDIVEVDPATTNPFTKAAIDLAQIGVKVAA